MDMEVIDSERVGKLTVWAAPLLVYKVDTVHTWHIHVFLEIGLHCQPSCTLSVVDLQFSVYMCVSTAGGGNG